MNPSHPANPRYGRTSAKGYWLAISAVACIAVSVLAAVVMHLALGDRFSLVSQTLSDYVHVESGAFLYGLATLALAPVLLALLAGVAAAGGPRSRALTWLSSAWAVGLVLVVLFPTDPGQPLTVAAQIHRYAAFVAFLALPAVGLLLARRLRGSEEWAAWAARIRLWSLVSAWVLLLQVLVRVPTTFPDLPLIGGANVAGLSERILLGVDFVLLLVMTLALLKVAARPRADRALQAVPASRPALETAGSREYDYAA